MAIISSGDVSDGFFWFFNSRYNNLYFVIEQNNIFFDLSDKNDLYTMI